ncbi:MAG: ATP-binding protein [Thermodesulfobacteriota bacterium]|nr:ATP-binding protein [Thermodesulfobacteriota bacterium]
MLNRLSIIQKIWLSLSILLIGYFVSLTVGIYVNIRTENRIAHVAETIFPASRYSQYAHQTFKEQIEDYFRSFSMGEKRFIQTGNQKGKHTIQYLENILSIDGLQPQTVKRTKALQAKLREYSRKAHPAFSRYLDLIGQDKMHTPEYRANEQQIVTLGNQVKSLQNEFSEFTDSLQADVKNELTEVRSITRQLRYLNVAVFFIVVTISLTLITILVRRSISQPLKKTFMLENAVKQSIDGIAVTDLSGNIRFVNRAWENMHGYAANELMDRHLSIINSETRFSAIAASETSTEEWIRFQKTYTGESENTTKDGITFPVLMTSNVLKNEQGKTSGLLIIAKDISEQKAKEAELEEARKQLLEKAHQAGMAEIATGIIHNVGNVLNSIKTSAYIILDQLAESQIKGLKRANNLLRENMDNIEDFITSNPKGKRLMEYYLAIEQNIEEEQQDIKNNIERLNEKLIIIEEIIAAQQNYATKAAFSEALPIADVIEDALTMQTGAIDRHGLKIIKDYHTTPLLSVQKTKLIHVLINLIKNAKDAMINTPPDEKQLTITIDSDENLVLVKITDNGCGIKSEHLEKVFTHGFTTKKTGHGFGLHSAANFMTEMGGRIWAESNGPDTGATFVLAFPKP